MINELKNLRIHITPDDILADIDEYADGRDPRSRCLHYIEPYGPYQINEVCDAIYYTGNTVPYHEHAFGYETFLVDAGSVEVMSRRKKAVAKKGDIVHYAPFTPHYVRFLEDGTIWRAFHQGIQMMSSKYDEIRVRDMYPDVFNNPAFKADMRKRMHGSTWYDYVAPESVEVPAHETGVIRPYDFGLANYTLEGIELRLKVGRWETGGAKEVWQLLLKSGYTLTLLQGNIHPLLFDVFSGSVEAKLDGLEPFIAKPRDLIHIPKFVAGSITALEDTVLFDAGCQGLLTRFMDELQVYKVREPAKLLDKEYIREAMKRYEYYVLFEGL